MTTLNFPLPKNFLIEYFNFNQGGTVATNDVEVMCLLGWVNDVSSYAYYLVTHHPFISKPVTNLTCMKFAVEGFTLDECWVQRTTCRTETLVLTGGHGLSPWVTTYTVEGPSKEQAINMAYRAVSMKLRG